MQVLLAGYSYGSLIASRTPSAEKLVGHCKDDGDVLAYATRTAYEWASAEKRRSFAMIRGSGRGRNPWSTDEEDDEEAASSEAAGDGEGKPKAGHAIRERLETSYLLISPLIPPVSFLLNIPNPLSWFQRKKHDEAGDVGGEEEGEMETLAVYGTNDNFTGVGRYRNWARERAERGKGTFKAVEVEGAGHFWFQEDEWMDEMRGGVAGWLDGFEARGREGTV
ncbi:hypothetical protein ABW19_dt0203205 [Dactylella cylindrospora]|nr:hypothetical protein ABW19_dt0203205 [Dactylella cylindrospora]